MKKKFTIVLRHVQSRIKLEIHLPSGPLNFIFHLPPLKLLLAQWERNVPYQLQFMSQVLSIISDRR